MRDNQYHVIVIGTGPGGEGAAMLSAKAGKRVAVVERHSRVGGACTHAGTIPSKALRHAIQRLREFNQNPLLGQRVRASYPRLLRTAEHVIAEQVSMRSLFYERNDVDLFRGTARFLDPGILRVSEPDGSDHTLEAEHFVIATGSRPYHPEDIDFGHPRILDSDTILQMKHTPRSITPAP